MALNVDTTDNEVTVTNLNVTGTLTVNGSANTAEYQSGSISITATTGVQSSSVPSTLTYVKVGQMVCISLPLLTGTKAVMTLTGSFPTPLNAVALNGGGSIIADSDPSIIMPCMIMDGSTCAFGSIRIASTEIVIGASNGIDDGWVTITETGANLLGIPPQSITYISAS